MCVPLDALPRGRILLLAWEYLYIAGMCMLCTDVNGLLNNKRPVRKQSRGSAAISQGTHGELPWNAWMLGVVDGRTGEYCPGCFKHVLNHTSGRTAGMAWCGVCMQVSHNVEAAVSGIHGNACTGNGFLGSRLSCLRIIVASFQVRVKQNVRKDLGYRIYLYKKTHSSL